MIIIYYGNVRQGKTYNAVCELLSLWLDGYTIYSNTWLAIPFKELTCDYILDIVEQNLDLPEDKVVFFIDEIPVFLMDSRRSMSKKNLVASYFISQSGKLAGYDKNNPNYADGHNFILMGTAQYPDMVDKRIRHFTDKGVECEKFTVDGEKYFVLDINIFRGRKTYSYKRIVKGNQLIYDMYDTRRKIKYQPDRYSKNSKEVAVTIV